MGLFLSIRFPARTLRYPPPTLHPCQLPASGPLCLDRLSELHFGILDNCRQGARPPGRAVPATSWGHFEERYGCAVLAVGRGANQSTVRPCGYWAWLGRI